MKSMKKILCALLGLAMLVSLTACQKNTSTAGPSMTAIPQENDQADSEEFAKWCTEQFVEAMEDDYLNLHYTVEDPSVYGITIPEPTLGTALLSDYDDAVTDGKETLDELHGFKFEELSKEQQYDYLCIEWYLNKSITLNSYPMLDFWFMPGTGLTDNLNTNFDEFVFRQDSDIDDYLTLLADTQRYFEEALALTRTQAEEGYYMQDYAVDDTIAGIDDFIGNTGEDNALVIGFNDKIDTYEGLTAQQVADYKAQNLQIVNDIVIPAYQEVKDTLNELKGSSSIAADKSGLSNYQDGKAYYEALAQYKSSSSDSIDDIYNKCLDYENNYIAQFQADMRANMDAYYEAEGFSWQEMAPEDILWKHEDNMYAYVPEGPDVTWTATFLNQDIASDSIVAYYLNPPLDHLTENVIRINQENVEGDPEGMFTTLAHEGFPGHCYQITYYLNTNPNPVRSTLNFIGYTEGWAMHAELYSYDWVGFENPVAAEYFIIDTVDGYVSPSIMDIGINYYGWDLEETAKELSKLYGSSLTGSDIKDMYEYVAARPGLFLSYGVGMMYMQTLHDQAKEALGDKFNEIDFNAVILAHGDRPYELVIKDVEAYIEANK